MAGKSIRSNPEMIEHLRKYGYLEPDTVEDVMKNVHRGIFSPERKAAYFDSPVYCGYNASFSPPSMHAASLELLKSHLQPGLCALDVGSGTGYMTACFAFMVGRQGRSVGVEHVPPLVAASIHMAKQSVVAELILSGCLSFHVFDGRTGWEAAAPYDAIHVGAAVAEIPPALINQLKAGGRMVIPVGQNIQELRVVDKLPDGSVESRSLRSVRFPPLTSFDRQMSGI